MLTKLLTIISFILVLCGLQGTPSSLFHLLILLVCITVIYRFAVYFGILPIAIIFNYNLFGYLLWLTQEIFKSSFTVITIILSKDCKINPTFEWVEAKLPADGLPIALYANSITLTPGTVTVNIEGNRLLVHALLPSSIEDLAQGKMVKKIQQVYESN